MRAHNALRFTGLLALALMFAGAPASAQKAKGVEDYLPEPMPPGFQVTHNELEGPVFATPEGKTVYIWPLMALRNGDAGEQKGKPSCDDHKYTENAGLMSPYPGGFVLPEVDTRPSCVGMWPPVLASDDAKAVGKFTIVKRQDGRKQWAYDGFALYTSVLDRKSGDVFGGIRRSGGRDGGGNAGGAKREAVGPAPNVPPGFLVLRTSLGRMITTATRASVYVSDRDGANKSNCTGACTDIWAPIIAPESAQPRGEFLLGGRPGLHALVIHLLGDLGLLQHLLDLAMQALDHGPGRARRREGADPGIDVVARQAGLGDGRGIGQHEIGRAHI